MPTLFDEAFAQAWEDSKTDLDRLYDTLTGGQWGQMPPQTTYRIYDRAGQLIKCHLESCTDHWVLEGLESTGEATVFICDHGQVGGPRLAIRKVSSVPVRDVGRYEIASEPSE